jgi:phosphoglycerol transferase MdoB-like AlkP superfamily enzyme
MLIDALKAADLYDNTILTFYGDHFGLPVYDWYSKTFVTELVGREYTYESHFNVPLIVHIPGSGVTETKSVAGGHIDVMPTLLHLLGLKNEKGIMFGESLLRLEKNAVYQQQHLGRGSFISDDVFYQFPLNGIALNAKANAIGTWEELNPADYTEQSNASREEIEQCMYLLDNNLVLIERYQASQNNDQK